MSPIKANLLCLTSMLVWAAGLPAAELLIGIIPPLPLTAMRMVLAAGALLPVWIAAEGAGVLRRAPWGRGIAIGSLMLGIAGVLLVVAQAASDPVTVAVISAAMPVLGIALETLLDGRRVTVLLALGLALSIGGGLLAYAEAMGSFRLGLGAAAAFASIACYTLGSRLTVSQLPGLTPLGRTTLTLAGAAVSTTLAAVGAAALGLPGPDWAQIGAQEIGALLVFSWLSLSLTQLLWIAAVGHLGIGLASLHMNAAPFYVMIFMFALGSAWNWMQALGAAVVGVGVLIAQSGPRPGQTKG